MLDRRQFLRLFAAAAPVAAVAPKYFFAPVGGWHSDVIACPAMGYLHANMEVIESSSLAQMIVAHNKEVFLRKLFTRGGERLYLNHSGEICAGDGSATISPLGNERYDIDGRKFQAGPPVSVGPNGETGRTLFSIG